MESITTSKPRRVVRIVLEGAASIVAAPLVFVLAGYTTVSLPEIHPDFVLLAYLIGGFGVLAAKPAGRWFRLACWFGALFVVTFLLRSLLGTFFKPAIYLYPPSIQNVSIEVAFPGDLAVSWPPYGSGWDVTAEPSGWMREHRSGLRVPYLFWEGVPFTPFMPALRTGWIVPGAEVAPFLARKLREIGLNDAEAHEFVVFWYPLLKDENLLLLHFATESYDNFVPLKIRPAPDSMLRVFMIVEHASPNTRALPQEFAAFTRTGFTVVEWGGAFGPLLTARRKLGQ